MPETTLPQPIRDYSRLSRAELALILKLSDDGKTQVFIAQQIGCHQSTVSDVLKDFHDTTGLAKRKAHNLALKSVLKLEQSMDAAAEKGTSGPMDSILKIAGVLGDESIGPRVIVQIGIQDSEVQIDQVNVIATYQTQTLSESQSGQSLPAPYYGANEAKVVGER